MADRITFILCFPLLSLSVFPPDLSVSVNLGVAVLKLSFNSSSVFKTGRFSQMSEVDPICDVRDQVSVEQIYPHKYF